MLKYKGRRKGPVYVRVTLLYGTRIPKTETYSHDSFVQRATLVALLLAVLQKVLFKAVSLWADLIIS